MPGDYKCSKINCERSFETKAERDGHSRTIHVLCIHCSKSFTTKGLRLHTDKCTSNPESKGRFECTQSGCRKLFFNKSSRDKHSRSDAHTHCVCGRLISTDGLKTHQRSCTEFRATEIHAMIPTCSGCQLQVDFAQHYLSIPHIEILTRMPESYKPVREVPPTVLEDLSFCNPTCFMRWVERNELLLNVFA